MITKLDTYLFRKAAENIADGSESFCCLAIGKPRLLERAFFTETFCPTDRCKLSVWFSPHHNTPLSEGYLEGYDQFDACNARVIALLLCELLAKEHNKELKANTIK